jgi:hypothetical protein
LELWNISEKGEHALKKTPCGNHATELEKGTEVLLGRWS